MRHRVKTKKFNRHKDAKKGLQFALIKSVIENKSITTTLQKAKYIRPKVEKLVTKAKKSDSLHTKRVLLSKLQNNKNLVAKLYDLAGDYKSANGGYMRILKSAKVRDGDNAKLAKLSFIEVKKPKADKSKTKSKVATKSTKTKTVNKKNKQTKEKSKTSK